MLSDRFMTSTMASVILLHLQLLVILLSATPCDSQLSVTLTHDGTVRPKDGDVEGSDFQLLCQVQNLTNGQVVVWQKDATEISSDPVKYQMTANETTSMYMLTILNLTRGDDTATYSCAVFSRMGNEVDRKSISVEVYYFPDAGNPMCDGHTVIEEGVPLTFLCQSQPGNPVVSPEWRRGVIAAGSIESGWSDDLIYRYSKYMIEPSKNDIGVNLTCKITSTAFPDMTSTCTIGPLVVNFRPSDVAITNTSFTQDNTTYDALSCSATAYPPDISYSWSFNVLLNSSQQMVTNDNQTLVILNISSCETLIVATCLATNDIGNATVNFTLCKPPPPPTTEVTTTELTQTVTEISQQSSTAASRISTISGTSPSTEPPTTTANRGENDLQSGTLTPALYTVIIGGALILFVLILGVACIVVKEKKSKTDEEEAVIKVYQEKNVRALSIAYVEEDWREDGMALTNQGFGIEALIQNEQDDLKTPLENEYMTDFLVSAPSDDISSQVNQPESVAGDKAPGAPGAEHGAIVSSDSGNQTDFDKMDDKHNKIASQQGGDEPEEKVAGHHDDPRTENADSSNDDDDEKMVDPTIEEEAQSYKPDERKSLVHEALLAVQVGTTNPDSTARAGHKVTPEMEF